MGRSETGRVIFPDEPEYEGESEDNFSGPLRPRIPFPQNKESFINLDALPQTQSNEPIVSNTLSPIDQAWEECLQEGLVLHEESLTCYELNERGPCNQGHWFVMDEETNSG